MDDERWARDTEGGKREGKGSPARLLAAGGGA